MFGLFPELWLTLDGCVPSYSWFITKLHLVLGSDIAGHSLRSGGATPLALEGSQMTTSKQPGSGHQIHLGCISESTPLF